MTGSASVSAVRASLAQGDVDAAAAQISALLEGGISPELLHLAALVDATSGRLDSAVQRLQLALSAEPARAAWHSDLGAALLSVQKPKEAEAAFEAALSLDPRLAYAWRGLARTLATLGRSRDAYAALHQSLLLDPTSAPAHRLAASLLRASGQVHAARRHEAEALRSQTDDAAVVRLALDCWRTDDLPAALRHARAAVDARAATPAFHGLYLYLLLFDPAQSSASLRAAHEEWSRRHAPPLALPAPVTAPDPCRRLRIGYLSCEFIGGPPVFFLCPFLAAHDRQQFEIYLYHASPKHDDHTEWFRGQACHWRECHALSDAELLQVIRHDRIDILIDPSGYGADHRLKVFAQRAAPLQVSYPSYPATRGSSQLDYIFSDRWATPPGSESHYTETPVLLPSGYLAYQPPSGAPAVTPLPASHSGHVTFGMFQRRVKLNASVFDALAEVLRRTPGSRLLLQTSDPTLDRPDSPARHGLIREFLLRGIPESRVRYCGARPRLEVMALLAETDIALDTFPFAGQTTTCESLWMGVPVVTLAGDTHPSRVGASLLEIAGLPFCIAYSKDEYVAIACRLAANLPELAALRQNLRQLLADSGFVNGSRLAREIEAAVRRLWRQWCAQQFNPEEHPLDVKH